MRFIVGLAVFLLVMSIARASEPVYRVRLCQVVTYWDSPKIAFCSRWESVERSLMAVEEFNYVSAKYGHEVKTWGATLREPVPVPPKDILEEISYYVDFDGDGKACRDHY